MPAPVAAPEPIVGYPGYPGYPPYRASPGLTVAGVVAFFQRRWRPIAVTGAVVASVIVLAALVQPTAYQAKALLLVDPGDQRVLAPDQSLATLAMSAAVVDSEIEAMNTREMAARVAQQLGLQNDPEFNPALRAPKGAPPPKRDKTPDRVANALDARRKGATNIVELTARSADPDKAALMANAFGQAYMASLLEHGQQAASQADSWLGGRIEQLRKEVNEAEAAVEAYRARAGLVAANGSTLSEQQSAETQTALLAAQTELAEAQARRQQVRSLIQSGGSPDAIGAVINSNLIRDLRGREADVARRRAELLSRYGPLHPQVIDNAAELSDIGQRIQSEVTRITQSLDSDVAIANAKVANLRRSMAQSRSQLEAGNAKLGKLRQLERDAAAARSVYESFLQRAHEISQQGGFTANHARLLSAATPPSQDTSPSLLIVGLAATILGLVAGVIAGLITEQLDDRLDSADDVERRLGLSTLASIPLMPRKALDALPLERMHPAQYLVEHPLSAFAESLRVVRAAIVHSPSDEPRRVIAITSALPGEGKTTLSLSLARMAALSGERVLLVDCDVRRRSVNDVLCITPTEGLLEVLSGERHWQEVIGRDEHSDAHVLPLSLAPCPLQERVGSRAMRQLLQDLASVYDLIVLDCPPVLAVAETRALVRMADMTIVVGRRGRTTARALGNAIQQIRVSGAAVAGVALNGVNPASSSRATSYSDALYFREAEALYAG